MNTVSDVSPPPNSARQDSTVSAASFQTTGSTIPLNKSSDQLIGQYAVDHELAEEFFFGCGPCHPQVVQFLFRRKKFFTFLLCSFAFLQSGLVSGLISVVISTLETRYNLTSTQLGAMVITYDITAIIGVVFVSYFGNKTHKPRLLGVAALVMSFGSLLFASPQFILNSYDYDSGSEMGSSQREECIPDNSDSRANSCNNANLIAYSILVISNIVLGLAVTPIYTIGVTYLDEIVYPKFVSLHVGLVSTMLITAPLVGLGLGSQFLSIYVDPWQTITLTEEDPAWVGAWWIPFIIVSICLGLLSIPFLMFPRYLPDSHLVREERVKEMAKVYSSKYANENSLSITFKMFPIHIKEILTNPSFIFLVLGLCSSYLFLQGTISFGPKYYEVQYLFTPSTAGLVAGAIGIPGAILGTLTGAFVVFSCKMKGRSNVLLIAIISFTSIFLSLVFLLHCPGAEVAGITVPYQESQEECIRSCNCTSTLFQPVCSSSGSSSDQEAVTYFSPCRAGCVANAQVAGSYENCTCTSNATTNGTATDGYCQSNCWTIVIPAIVVIAIMTYIVFVITLPYLHAIIRVVADEQRALALGVQSAMTRLLGTVPGPLIFGALFDASCLSWQEECGQRGNCWIYDRSRLSYYAISISLPSLSFATLFFFISWLCYPRRKNKDDSSVVTFQK